MADNPLISKKAGIAIGILGTVAIVSVIVVINRKRVKTMVTKINQLLDSGKSITGTAADVAHADAFDPAYYKKYATVMKVGVTDNLIVNGGVAMTGTTAKEIADAIYAAYHTFLPNDQAAMLKEVASTGSKVKLSYVAEKFLQGYGKSLGDFLVNNLSDDNKVILQNTVNGLT